MKNVVEKSIYYNLLSKGYFDITSKPLSDLWGFGFKSVNNPPTEKQIKNTLQYVGVNMLYFKNDSLLKTNPNTQIDCNGIAQGYSVDVLCNFLKAKKLNNFIVELGGEIKTSGSNIMGKPWIVGIEHPGNFNGNDFLIDKKIAVSNFAVTTSGNYRKLKKYGTKYVTHIINPLTGKPMDSEIISVTVIAKTAMQADALDNVFALLGINDSFELLSRLPETGMYILYQHSSGKIRDTCNQFFEQHLVSN
jgi:thiamine biosynthesis lipoprotein